MNLNVAVDLARTDCCVCGTVFAIPVFMYNKRLNDGGDFYCPNGHELSFTVPRCVKLQRELDLEKRRLAESSATLARERTANLDLRIESEKRRRRINAGLCPHCRRNFHALARHIKTKHPSEPLPNRYRTRNENQNSRI